MSTILRQKNITPVSFDEVRRRVYEAYVFAVQASDEKYGRGRGAEKVLDPGQDYAELPGFGDKNAREIISTLSPGNTILDVGCGYGQLGAEIQQTINPNVEVYGFDAQRQPGQERLKQVVIGNIDDLSPPLFDGLLFDLVVSSALLYHLPDYWGAVLRMSRMLKPQGVLLASTMPRIVRDKGTGRSHYFRDRNVLDIQGQLVASDALIELLNSQNRRFKLEYSVIDSLDTTAVQNVGGRLSGKRSSQGGYLDLPHLFYCLSNENIGYVIARTSEEKEHLQRAGFIGVQERLDQC
jgi:SAM-dependent methyltransferase